MSLVIRKSIKNESGFLEKIENECFPEFQRSNKRNIIHSLNSHFQEVFVLEKDGAPCEPIGALTLFKYRKSLRIYSVAVLPAYRNNGAGDFLIKYVFSFAKRYRYERILLEVHIKNHHLIEWYKAHGFKVSQVIRDYYRDGEDALKMEYCLELNRPRRDTRNIIVINQPQKWTFPDINAKVISVKDYIGNALYQHNTDLRIFNLCSSYKYQSYGYYVSLLASARGQRIIPSLLTIRDLRLVNVIRSMAFELEELIGKTLSKAKDNRFCLHVYFGQSYIRGFNDLAMKLYQIIEAPLFKVLFVKHETWIIKEIKVLTLNQLPDEDLPYINELARKYFDRKRFNKTKVTNYKYDLAILVNPVEKTPPSCGRALQKFKIAANRRGMYAEFITKNDIGRINEFDALFIRETTGVNNHTYEFSRTAYAEGLAVIDDPWSILKCSNKIFQNEVLRRHKILTPQTMVLTKNLFSQSILDKIIYPAVIKEPDGAFSRGITKVENKKEAYGELTRLFKKSDMVICQEYIYSEFDWRIGIVDNNPLFACKYFMSEGHWQIYDWKGKEEAQTGDCETLSLDSVPVEVLKTAVKASAIMGNGLYGVDLKTVNGKVYVIEVNDNPNIDHGIEDLVLKDKLYDQIIDTIYKRIEILKNIKQ